MSKNPLKPGRNNKLAIFEGSEIRRILVDGEWHYSLVDVIQALTDSTNPRRYWNDLKTKMLAEETFQLSDIIVQLKLLSQRCVLHQR